MADRPAQIVCFLDPEQAPYGLLFAFSHGSASSTLRAGEVSVMLWGV
jgi:hypothetical protein